MAIAPIEPKPPDPHHLAPSCNQGCFFCSLSSDSNRNYVLSPGVDSGRRDLGKRKDPWMFATVQLPADLGMKLIDSAISSSESLSPASGRVLGGLSEKLLRSVMAFRSMSKTEAQLSLLSPSPRVLLFVFPSLVHRIRLLTCEGECCVFCLSNTTNIESVRWVDAYDSGWMLNVPITGLLVFLCCIISWFTSILLNCACCVLVWLWFSPSICWRLLLGNYCQSLLYVWIQACRWMRMVCNSCVSWHDNDLRYTGLRRRSGLTLVILFGRLLLWSPVVSWLCCLALWNRSLLMLRYVVAQQLLPSPVSNFSRWPFNKMPFPVRPIMSTFTSETLLVVSVFVVCIVFVAFLLSSLYWALKIPISFHSSEYPWVLWVLACNRAIISFSLAFKILCLLIWNWSCSGARWPQMKEARAIGHFNKLDAAGVETYITRTMYRCICFGVALAQVYVVQHHVISYSHCILIKDNMWKFWSASYLWLAYCDYVRSGLPDSGGHVSRQRPGCADRNSVTPFFGLIITACNLRHLHHLSRFWLGVCLTDSGLALLMPTDRTTPLSNILCNNYLMQWFFESYLGVIMPRKHPSCSWFEVLCRSPSAIVSVADEDLQRGGVVIGVELYFFQCKQFRRSSFGPRVVTKCSVDVGSHQEVLASIRCAGQSRLNVCIGRTRAHVGSRVADLSMNGCIVIMYCSFNVMCSLYFLMALSIMFVVYRVRCIISHPVTCIYGCRIPSIIICNFSAFRVLEQHYSVLGLCSMALDGHPWMLRPTHDGCCLIKCCTLMHSYRSFAFQLWTIVASTSALCCLPVQHLL